MSAGAHRAALVPMSARAHRLGIAYLVRVGREPFLFSGRSEVESGDRCHKCRTESPNRESELRPRQRPSSGYGKHPCSEGAKECSPRRKPWEATKKSEEAPEGRKKIASRFPRGLGSSMFSTGHNLSLTDVSFFRPFGAWPTGLCFPTACAVGCTLPPLRGLPRALIRGGLRGAKTVNIRIFQIPPCAFSHCSGINNSPRAFVWLAGRFSATLVRVRHLRFRGIGSLNRPGHGA